MATITRRVRLSSKGQLVVPREVRESLGIGAGDELVLHVLSDRVLLAEVVEPSPLQQAVARLRASAAASGITREQVAEAVDDARREAYAESQQGSPGA